MSPKETENYFIDRNVNAERQSYAVGDRSITFVSVVNQEKPTVFFFHGAPGSWSAFKEFLVDSLLIDRFSLVSVDRPGYGHSDFGRVEPSLKNQAYLMKPLLEKYAITPNILVGHSLGGPVIAKIAMEYPDLVDGLIMVAPSIDPDLEPEEDWFRVPMQSPLVNWAIPTSFLVTNEEILFLEEELRTMLPHWSEIKAPTIVIQGNGDRLVAPGNAQFAERMLINSKQVDLVIKDDVSHFIPWSRPELIKAAILKLEKKKGRLPSSPLD